MLLPTVEIREEEKKEISWRQGSRNEDVVSGRTSKWTLKMSSCIHSFIKYLLSTYYVLGPNLGKQWCDSALMNLYCSGENGKKTSK